MKDLLLERLRKDGLLEPAFVEQVEEEERDEEEPSPSEEDEPSPERRAPPPPHLVILRLCDRRALKGALSVALGVRPDELIGPLCLTVGGSGKDVRVLDVRDRPYFELRIRYGELEEPWEVEDLYGLVQNLNDLLKDDRQAKVVAILGEWQDALQLWCVPKSQLGHLLRQDYFAPRNRHQLEDISAPRR